MNRTAQKTRSSGVAPQAILDNAEGTRHADPDAGDEKQRGREVERAKPPIVCPPPAKDQPSQTHYQAGDQKEREAGVCQHQEVGKQFGEYRHGFAAVALSSGKESHESPGRNRALYSQKETGFPRMSRR